MAGGELRKRLVVAGVGIPVGIVLIYLGGWALGGAIAIVAAIAAHEFYGLARARGARPYAVFGVPGAAAVVLLATLEPTVRGLAPAFLVLLLVLTLGALAASIWLRWPEGEPILSASITVLGVLYTGGTLAFAVLIRHFPDQVAGPPAPAWVGSSLLILPLVIAWFGDSCAYFAGNAWGRKRLIPAVSPGKTWVGGVAGLAGAVGSALLLGVLLLDGLPVSPVPWWAAGVIGLLVGLAAQVGDLTESVLKREAGLKDSGHWLPGHGGALDRFDAIFFALPLTYGLLVGIRWLG